MTTVSDAFVDTDSGIDEKAPAESLSDVADSREEGVAVTGGSTVVVCVVSCKVDESEVNNDVTSVEREPVAVTVTASTVVVGKVVLDGTLLVTIPCVITDDVVVAAAALLFCTNAT